MLPMRTAYAALSGEVTQRTIDHYGEKAQGGVGLITVGNISIHRPTALNQLVLDSDWLLMGHYELVEKVHAQKAKIIAQLNHPGRQQFPEARRPGEEQILVSSSPVAMTFMGKVLPTPKALSKTKIYQFIERYASAAERAKRVGYDMVEVHGGHGYLVNQFISPSVNMRKDEFGGSLENRMRFPLELIKAVRSAVGPNFPVGFRLSAVEFVPGGIDLNQSTTISQMLEAAGVAYISVTAGTHDDPPKVIDLMRDPEGWREYIWEEIKKAVKVPVIAGGGLRHPDFCERLLEQGKADFIGLARPLLADPDWPKKAKEGAVEDIRLCISCNECLGGSARRRRGGGARRCAVNAAVGRDREFARVTSAPAPKRVMVIGGGPGGLEAARVAAMRGHRVTLYEKEEELGGQLVIAGKPQSKKRLLWLREYLTTQIDKLRVKVELGVGVTPRLVEETKPDAVVVATGAEPVLPNIPGINGKRVMSAWNLLGGKANLEKASVAVVGGGLIGCEVADYLLESENRVTIIEQLPSVASDMEPFHRFRILQHFNERNVGIITGRKAARITETGVHAVNLGNGQEELVDADWVVIAVGARPVNGLADALKGIVQELHSVGDCNEPRVIMEAIYEGSLAGRQI
jgi:2,4-dienoyl-CoA reductase-like NADH-dependent reductase (Old Yellow Enzyme family)/thioredoxin reductase